MITGGKSFVSSPPAFSNDGKRILICTGNTVSVFSTSTGLQTTELEGHKAEVTSVIVVPVNKVMCYCWTSSLDGTIRYWDFTAPELMKTIEVQFPIHSMVIPGLLTHSTDSSGKVQDLFAYLHAEDVKQEKNEKQEKENQEKEKQKNKKRVSWCGLIVKCNLTKSRILRGAALAETHKPGSITVSPSGKYIGICDNRKLRLWEIPAKDSDGGFCKKIRLHHTKSLTTLAFHPTESVVAAGDATGRILIWRGVWQQTFSDCGRLNSGGLKNDDEERPGVRDNDDADSCTTWHWHSAQVNVLFFSSDGAYLYSGGREGVLVVWQLDTGKKKYLPRIGSPLRYFVNSPDPTLLSISCTDNRVHLLRMPSMEILRSISGIQLPSSSMNTHEGFGSVIFNRTLALIAVPTENYRIQIYSLLDDREIAEVQICERNHQPVDEITVKINLIALSSDGSTMSTVETRFPEEEIGSLVSLKFWACDTQNKHFSLSTVIYEPHREADISAIAFRPIGHMAVSSSYGGDFKIWIQRHDISLKDQTMQNAGWTCHAVGSYKKKPMTAAAFSSDGSVLAVAAETLITLWDPDRNTLLAVMGNCLEQITTLSFVGKSEYLVSASRGTNSYLTLWSLSELRMAWSYKLDVEAVTSSMEDSTFSVLALPHASKHRTSPEAVILLFNVKSPLPVSSWSVTKARGGGLSFIKSVPTSEDEVGAMKTKDEVLAYVNNAREYVLFSPYDNRASKLSSLRQRNFGDIEETERFGYTSIYGEIPEFRFEANRTQLPTMPSEKTWEHIFSGPSHALPPLTKLCSTFLESLLERRSTSVE